MINTIYKFETQFNDLFRIEMPKDAEILCVQVDQKTNIPCIWAVVDIENKLEDRYFELFGTGSPIKIDIGISRKYIGTYQFNNGMLIFHLFERL